MALISYLISRSENYRPVQRTRQALFPVRESFAKQSSSMPKIPDREIVVNSRRLLTAERSTSLRVAEGFEKNEGFSTSLQSPRKCWADS
jgi:hypothetical protein